ncbi:MAG: endonuclease V, partial [Armatimonadetes bacterium]|nr:endonuclease V [Armatimonadota bacterium]
YRPGRLAYAVGPAVSAALLRLLEELGPVPVLVHGHGQAHPRRFGLACYLGRLHGLVTVGVAEKLLVGEHEPVPARRGAWKPVVEGSEVLGAALRTRAEAKVLYVSVGHGCELEEAIELVMLACRRYRWPEPLRQARMRLKPAIRRRLDLHAPRWQRRFGARPRS